MRCCSVQCPKANEWLIAERAFFILSQGSCDAGALDTVCLRYIVCCNTHYVKVVEANLSNYQKISQIIPINQKYYGMAAYLFLQ